MFRAGIDYSFWLGPAPNEPLTRPKFHYDWHWQWPYGNGDLGNQGVHQMDIARWGLGEPGWSTAWSATAAASAIDDAGDTPNTAGRHVRLRRQGPDLRSARAGDRALQEDGRESA